MARKSYPSDLSDEQWEVIKPLLPKSKEGGRPRTVDLREILNAIFYVNKTGCPWRWLPNDFPPWQTVYTYFREWRIGDIWEKNKFEIEKIFTKTGRKRITGNSWYYRQSECEDYFSRRQTRIRWWEEDQWPQTPHFS